MFEGQYDNNWVFGLSLGMFVYAGMGVLLPELDTAIGNSVEHGYNKWVCLAKGIHLMISVLRLNVQNCNPLPKSFKMLVS